MLPGFAMAIEHADCVIVDCEFGVKNFQYANKPIYLVPNAVPYRYPWVDSKDFKACRSRFLWLGSEGMVHKGLDLVLEAFVGMPEYHLTVCGPVASEKDFEQAYFQELYHTPNIHTHGWIDVEGSEFRELVNRCLGLVYPSCSDTSPGSVLTCLHAGLLPIVSYESGVDIEKDFGVILPNCSIEAIQEAVHKMAACSLPELKQMSRKAWEFAQAVHTIENFKKEYRIMVEDLLAEYKYNLNLTCKDNSTVQLKGSVGVASRLLFPATKRNTDETVYPIDPGATLSDPGLVENGTALSEDRARRECPQINH